MESNIEKWDEGVKKDGCVTQQQILNGEIRVNVESDCDHDFMYKILFDHTGVDICTKCELIKKQSDLERT